MLVLTVVGARPQFVKCAVVSRVLREKHKEYLVHTGQHHDQGMSERFFLELDIPEPDLNLGISGGSHGQMTGRMLAELESVMRTVRPDWVLVYGDTNSTLAGALAAAKLNLRVAHVEAGLRSFNRRMPEEVNRVLTDHVASLLFCPTESAVRWLAREGITAGVHNVGDVMYDSVLANLQRALMSLDRVSLFRELGFQPGQERYAFATLHRAENTDDPARLGSILDALSSLGVPVLLPLHPRTQKVLAEDRALAARVGPAIRVVDPVGYLETLFLLRGAALVLTDSGGLQKEAYFLGVRCLTLRDETEWPETVDAGANRLVGAATGLIREAAAQALAAPRLEPSAAGPFGDGHAAEKIVSALERAG